jgi:hypothetical protein
VSIRTMKYLKGPHNGCMGATNASLNMFKKP